MTVIPFGEYRPDTSDFNDPFTAEISNALPRGDGYGPIQGFSALSQPTGGGFSSGFSSGFDSMFATDLHRCRGFFKAINTDGSVSIFAASLNRLYKLNTTNYTWTDVSKGGVVYPSLSATDQWQFVQYINYVIAVQANAPPQFLDLTGSQVFADLAGSPPQARYVAVVGDFVVLTGLLNNPYRVQWSSLGDPTGWVAGVNSSSFQDLPDGGITRGVAGGEYGNIFQDTAIRRLIYAPGNPVIFQIERITEDRGLYAPYSLIRSGDQIFFLSALGFMKMSPTGYPQSIGKERVDRTLLADIDAGNIQLVLGASDPRNARVFWAYKSVGSSTQGQFDKLVCYDYALDRWAPAAHSGQFICSLSQPGLTLENLDTLSSSIDALVSSLDSFVVTTSPQFAMVDATSSLGFLAGLNLEATLATGAQEAGPRRVSVRGMRPITDAPIVYGSVGKRERLSDTETFTTESIVNTSGMIPARASTRFARGKLRIPAGTAWTFATGIEPEIALEGGR